MHIVRGLSGDRFDRDQWLRQPESMRARNRASASGEYCAGLTVINALFVTPRYHGPSNAIHSRCDRCGRWADETGIYITQASEG